MKTFYEIRRKYNFLYAISKGKLKEYLQGNGEYRKYSASDFYIAFEPTDTGEVIEDIFNAEKNKNGSVNLFLECLEKLVEDSAAGAYLVFDYVSSLRLTNDGVGGKRYKPVNIGKGDEVLWLVRKWKRQRTKQDLLLVLNRTLLKYNLQELNCFDELGNREGQEMFVVLETMLGYAGYVSEALKYYLMMEPITCNACREDYILADLWNY